MILKRLTLTNYRNIESATIDLHPRLTVFLGPNGVGKTNILESIHLLSFPRSFRTRKDDQLKMWKADYCRVEGIVEIDRSEHSLVFFHDKSKKLQYDGQALNVSTFVGQFLSVLFAPEDVDLLSSSPSRRRGFLDAHLSMLSQQFFNHLLNYNKVIKQRNKLLSKPNISDSELSYWNEQQILHGTAMIQARLDGINEFNQLLFPELTIRYISSLVDASHPLPAYFEQLQSKIINREKAVGHTLIGPHRDDWVLEELGTTIRDLGVYGSRGEQRMGIVKLKQAALANIHKETDERAVMLLDDVLSELDAHHQEELLSTLGDQQTVLTTASLSDVPTKLLTDATVYEVKDGQVSTLATQA